MREKLLHERNYNLSLILIVKPYCVQAGVQNWIKYEWGP